MSTTTNTTPLYLGVRVGKGNRFVPILPGPPEWTERGLCAQTDPDAFFPEKGGTTREAKAVCGRCEVRTECLEAAMAREERFGVWGGLSERERRRLRKSRELAATRPTERERLPEERRAAA